MASHDGQPPRRLTEAGEEIVAEGPEAERRLRRLSRRSFLWGGLALGGTLGGLYAFNKYAPDADGTKAPFRKALLFNEAVAERVFFSPNHMAKEFPRESAQTPRNNYHGNTPLIDVDAWRLKLEGADGPQAQTLTLADVKSLPEVSQTTELKCVEGWSTVVNWSGARFVDFAKKYPPPAGTRFVAMASEPEGWEDDWYYVGLDLASCLHPQTLLAWKMNGEELTTDHGAPLRLVMPHKYGIKQIKLITRIAYAATRPADYWAEQGYDWYAGL
jgi:DMSO/TMAO reductase YedYZ molybdopterin-dependent catalytic subunit